MSDDVCDWCGQPMIEGERCRMADFSTGRKWWHMECAEVAFRPFDYLQRTRSVNTENLEAEGER